MNLRRWICIVLLLVAPLQLSWGAVSAYCQHESGAAAKHVGHHDHQHDGGSGTEPSDGDPARSGGIDPDCAGCHMCCAPVLLASVRVNAIPNGHADLKDVSGLPSSAAFPPPYRPQWRLPA